MGFETSGGLKMPIYEYECDRCGKITEAMQKFSDPPLTECGYCHCGVHKLISASTFHLKGSGWYVTDYCGKNQSVAQANQKKESSESKVETKTTTSAAKDTAA